MKKITLFIAVIVFGTHAFGQDMWNKKLPIPGFSASPFITNTQLSGDRLLFSSSGCVLELNMQGVMTGQAGYFQANNPIWLSGFLQKRSNSIGSTYFLGGWRSFPDPDYNLGYYFPETGVWKSSLSFGIGELGTLYSRSPAVIPLNDSTLLVFTKSFVRKVACSNDTLSMEWEKPYSTAPLGFPRSAVLENSIVVFVTSSGEISAVNSEGVQLWIKAYNSYQFKEIIRIGSEFAVCGKDASGKAAMVKLDLDGNLIWGKTFAEELEFTGLTVSPNGNFALTGKSINGNIPLLTVSPNGDLVWKKSFQQGIGGTIFSTPDAGFFLTAVNSSGETFGIKTNAQGETLDPVGPDLFRERQLNNGGFSLIQGAGSSMFFGSPEMGLQIPADSNTTTLFIHTPWIAGKDAAGKLHNSASYFGENSASDYRLGLSSGPAEDFKRVWLITRDEIARVRRDYREDGVLNSPPPFDMLTWPGKGNPYFIQNLNFSKVGTSLDSLPAPFVDANGDGVYNVFDGDYPKLKGDRMIWRVITDQKGDDQNSHGQALGVDILMTIYAYDCPQNGATFQSVFVDYVLLNRSGQDYFGAYLGFYTDPDIGCPFDDYIGNLPDANSAYAYNQGSMDNAPSSFCGGVYSANFGEKIPVESLTFLNQSLDNSFSFTEDAPVQDLYIDSTFYLYLQGLLCNGMLPTMGGTGCDSSSNNFTHFLYSGNPSDPQGWSMCSETLHGDDFRMINSHGPFTFAADDTFSMQIVFTFHPDIPHPCPNIEELVKPNILQIKEWHEEGTLEAHLDLGSVLTLAAGQSLQLNATQSNPATAYNWSTGQTTSIITVNQTGEYTVTITPATGCAYAETVLVKSASGVNTPTLPTWQVQPNPAHDVLKITFEGNAMPVTAILRNAQGQAALTKTSTENAVELSVANLPSGFYWAELWRDGLFLGSRKVVVAR